MAHRRAQWFSSGRMCLSSISQSLKGLKIVISGLIIQSVLWAGNRLEVSCIWLAIASYSKPKESAWAKPRHETCL